MLSSLLSAILNPSFVSLLQFYVLFYSPFFLEHLFAPIMGRFEEPNIGLPILGSQYRVNCCFWVLSASSKILKLYLHLIGYGRYDKGGHPMFVGLEVSKTKGDLNFV